jgi:hypothetical protein
MALEDAAVLSRLVAEAGSRAGIADAFRRLEATRKARTSKVQLTSRANRWLREKTDVDWVYSYNPWTTPLAALETVAARGPFLVRDHVAGKRIGRDDARACSLQATVEPAEEVRPMNAVWMWVLTIPRHGRNGRLT